MEKGEIARNEQFLLSHSVFYLSGEPSVILIKFKLSRANSFSLEESKICRFGKGLRVLKLMIVWRFVCLGFYAVSTVFQLINGDSSQIHVSWAIFNQYLISPLSWDWRASRSAIPIILSTTTTSLNSHYPERQGGKATTTSLRYFWLCGEGLNLGMLPAYAFQLDEAKILSSGKGSGKGSRAMTWFWKKGSQNDDR